MQWVKMSQKFGNNLCIGFRLKGVSFVYKKLLDILVVGNDPIVNHYERIVIIRPLRMSVYSRRDPMSSPTSMGDSHVCGVNTREVQITFLYCKEISRF